MSKLTLRTPICDYLGIEYPIILAGMGPAAHEELTAAVSNAGGLGVLGRSTPYGRPLSPEELRARIRRTRDLTDKPFGVDLILPSTQPETADGTQAAIPQRHKDYVEQLRVEMGLPILPLEGVASEGTYSSVDQSKALMEVVCEEGVPIFASGLGLTDWSVPMCRKAGMKIIALVGNVKNARRVVNTGADIVGAQGYDAGGHTGRVGTFSLIPQVVDAISPVPVLAAGGIVDGRGIAAALALGAQGVWCGTAFLATVESPILPGYKQKILEMNEEGTVISKSVSGKTVRVIRNRWTDAWERGPLPTLPFPYQFASWMHIQRAAYETGNIDAVPMATGQGGGMVNKIKPAGEVVREMVAQAVEILSKIKAPLEVSAK